MERRSTPHGPSCAKRIREAPASQTRTVQQIALVIQECCSVTKLRAQRLARGWTQREAADFFRQLAQETGPDTPRADNIQLGQWENGRHEPRRAAVEILCRLYETDPDALGLGPRHVVRLPSQTLVAPTHHLTAEMQPARYLDPFSERVDAARRSVDRTLATSSVNTAQLDQLDERLLWVRQQYVYTPPAPMLQVLLDHVDEVKDLAVDRQPASVQVRLSQMTALLATLVADALMKLGSLPRSRAWYGTARTAADDSGNIELRARVRAQAAMLPYYYGPLEGAISLAREARLISRARPTATGAFAAAAEARALAQRGDKEAAETAIRYARSVFDRCDPGADNDAFAFPPRRLLLYLSGAYTAMAHTSKAREVQAEALRMYPARTGIDPALLHLEAAICLAQDRSPTEACQLAGATYLGVLPAQRTPILEERARQVIGVLPPAIRSSRAARDLGEILALPPGEK